jgi:hypothetical protein
MAAAAAAESFGAVICCCAGDQAYRALLRLNRRKYARSSCKARAAGGANQFDRWSVIVQRACAIA